MKRLTGFVTPIPRLAVFILLTICLLPSARAADWTYRVRPTDNIWDLSRRYLRPDVSWQQLQLYNKLADPYHLPPGMRLQIPVTWLRVQPAKATVVAVIGSASARQGAQARSEGVKAGMSYGMGTQLSTDAGASLILQFADGSRVLMRGGSALELDRLSAYGSTGMVDTRLRLQRGRVIDKVTDVAAAAHFAVQTPDSIPGVRGTHASATSDGGAYAVTGALCSKLNLPCIAYRIALSAGAAMLWLLL